MNSKKPINVGVSSALIDLKAELIRKQQQLKAGGSSTTGGGRNRGALKTQKKSEALRLMSKDYQKNKGVDKRNQKDVERQIEEEKNLEKSKSALEAKAKLYDKMQSAALVLGDVDGDDEEEEGGSGKGDAVKQLYSNSLVNFQQKAVEEIEERRRNQQVENEKKKFEEAYPIDEEEWAEFTDGLGRTRKCLKTELPSFLEREEERLAMPENPGICLSAKADDRLREMKREKWELEAELLAAKDKVHYQDILFDEVRTHGVGFYAFARDEAKRAEQMRELKKASEITEQTRKKVKKERKEKNSAMKVRIKKIRDRKRAKAGLPPLPNSEEEEDEEETDEKNEEDKTDDPEHKPPEIRAWDVGKPGVFGPKPTTFDELDQKWLKDRRSDRNPEFAPPTSIYSEGGLKRQYNSQKAHPDSSASSSSSKYSNFVRSSDPIPPQRPATSSSSSSPPPPPVVIEPQPKPFRPPENFWRKKTQQQAAAPQKPIPIKDETPAPIPLSSEEFDRERGGVEVAPPPTFEYYHGGEPKVPRRRPPGQSDECVNDAVSTGLKALREQFESRKQKQPSSSKVFPEFN